MIARQKPLTPREKQESEPKTPKYYAHNRTDAKLEEQIADLLRDGMKAAEIVKELGVGKAVVYRVYNETIMGKKPVTQESKRSLPRQDSPYATLRCSGLENCRCVKCDADRLKTPERIRLMHADDEQERLESHLDALERRGLRSVVDPTPRTAK